MDKKEIKTLVERYNLTLYGDDNVKFGGTKAQFAEVLPTLKECKEEVLAYLKEQEAERKARYEDRVSRINAIEGLSEIKEAQDDLARWRYEFNKSFDDVGSFGVRPKPNYDMDELYEKYPIAASYLKAENYRNKENVELSTIGEKALERIIYHPEEHLEAIEEMNRDLEAFRDRHAFD